MSAGVAGSDALLRTRTRGTPSGRGGGRGLVHGPAGAPGALGAASPAPLRGAGTGRGGPPPTTGLPLAQPTGTAQSGAEYLALGAERRPPPPPTGSSGHPDMGGGATGAGGEPQWIGIDGAGRAATPPPLPSPSAGAPGGSAALDGGARGRAPNERLFSAISRALMASRAPPGSPPPPPRRAKEGGEEPCRAEEGGGGAGGAMGEAPASAPLLPSPPLPPQEAAKVARDADADSPAPDGVAPRCPAAVTPSCPCHRRRSGRGRGGWGSGAPCRPCVMRTGPPRASHAGVTGGCGIAAPGTTKGTLDWCQRREVRTSARCSGWEACAPCPCLGGGGGDDDNGGALRGSALRWHPQGARGARDAAMGGQRGQTPDPGRPVLPLRRDFRGGWGATQPLLDP